MDGSSLNGCGDEPGAFCYNDGMNAPAIPDHKPGAYRLKVSDYLTLAGAGAFGDQRTEFLEGEIVVLSPQYRPQLMTKMHIYDALRDALRDQWPDLRPVMEGSVAIDDQSMPDPDISLTTEPNGPGPMPISSIVLAVEVADTTLRKDLHDKAALYARVGLAEYWVVDVEGRAFHQMWTPTPEGYADRRRLSFGEPLTATTIEGLSIDTAVL